MTALRLIIFSSTMLLITAQLSCIRAPIIYTMDQAIEISGDKIQDIADEILSEMKKFSFGAGLPAAGVVNPADCQTAFNGWIEEQFVNGLIPKRIVQSFEYADKNMGANPLLIQCRSVNIPEEFEKLMAKNSTRLKKIAQLFDLEALSDAVSQSKCTKQFADPAKGKISIIGISFKVTENTLNINSPVFNIYYTTEKIIEADAKIPGAEQTMINDGSIIKFAESPAIPPRFEGVLPFKLDLNTKSFKRAEKAIISLESDILAVPELLSTDISTTTIAGEPYYLVPKGSAKFNISLDISLKIEVADGFCSLDEIKEDLRDANKKRREEFEQNQGRN